MAVMRSASRWLCALLGAAWIGCSSPQPSGGSGTTNDGGPAIIDGMDERCTSGAYNDGACDQCQNAHCCIARFQCYDDKACYWADEWTLDECLDPGSSDAGPGDGWSKDSGSGGWDTGSGGWDSGGGSDSGPMTPDQCWQNFENDDPLAAALYQCVHDNCATECFKSP